MSLIRRTLGRAPRQPAIRVATTPFYAASVPDDGQICELPRGAHVAVHGESFRQSAIKALLPNCQLHPTEGRPTCDVVLMAEADNSYDSNAVAVHAATGHVGYLPREIAPEWAEVFTELHRRGYAAGRCGALITGGQPGKPTYGIVLLLDYPDVCLRQLQRS